MKNKQFKDKTPSGDVKNKTRIQRKWGNLQKRVYPSPIEEFFRDGIELEKKHP